FVVPTPNGIQQLAPAFPNRPVTQLMTEIGPGVVQAGNPTYGGQSPNGLGFDCSANFSAPECTPIEFGTITRSVSAPFNDYEGTGRVDFHISEKDDFF